MATRSLKWDRTYIGGEQTVQIYGNFGTFRKNSALFRLVIQQPPGYQFIQIRSQWTARKKTKNAFLKTQKWSDSFAQKSPAWFLCFILAYAQGFIAISFEDWAWDITDIHELLVTITRPPGLGKSRKTSEKFRGESWSVLPGWLFYI